jgi:hypothetical protein
MKVQFKRCCMWFAALSNICIKCNILGLTGAKSFWQNPRWYPFKIKIIMPSTPSLNEYIYCLSLSFYPCQFSLDSTFNRLIQIRCEHPRSGWSSTFIVNISVEGPLIFVWLGRVGWLFERIIFLSKSKGMQVALWVPYLHIEPVLLSFPLNVLPAPWLQLSLLIIKTFNFRTLSSHP